MAGDNTPRYDRHFLLSPAKRNQIIELWEVEKFGHDSFTSVWCPNLSQRWARGRHGVLLGTKRWQA